MQKIFVLLLLCCLCSCVTSKKTKHSIETDKQVRTEQQTDSTATASKEANKTTELDILQAINEQEGETTKVESGIDTLFNTDSSKLHMQLVAGQDAHFESSSHKVDALWNDSTGVFDITVVQKPQSIRLNTKRTETTTRNKSKTEQTQLKQTEATSLKETTQGHVRRYGKTEQREQHKETVKEKESTGIPGWVWAGGIIIILILFIIGMVTGKSPIPIVLGWVKKLLNR